MKVKDLIQKLQAYDPNEEVAYSLWSREDVRSHCEDHGRGEITDKQCDEVLRRFENLGCEVGQSWDSLDVIIDNVLGN